VTASASQVQNIYRIDRIKTPDEPVVITMRSVSTAQP
jgi:hypothetical protein